MIEAIHDNILSTLFAFLFCLVLCACDSSQNEKKVLVVHSYDSSYEGYIDYYQYLVDDFKKKGITPEIREVYVDCEKYLRDPEIKHINDELIKLQGEHWTPDIILVNDDQAHFSFLKTEHPWTHEKPIVIGGVNFPNWRLIRKFNNVTGVYEKIDYKKNIEVIEDFMKTDFLAYAFVDSTYLDRVLRKDVAEQIDTAQYLITRNLFHRDLGDVNKPFVPKGKDCLAFCPIRAADVETTFWNLSQLNPNLPYCYLHVKQDYVTIIACDLCNVKKFTAINEYFGYRKNFIAGYITPLWIQAEEMVDIATEILNGKKPSDIPIRVSRKAYVADWFALRRWHIDPETLDHKYQVINYPLYVKYKSQLCWIIALAAIFVGYVISHLYRTREKEKSKKLQALHNLETRNDQLASANSQLQEQKMELIRARELAEKAELKQSFLTNMSHEIRTPLNAIVGFTNLLADKDSSQNLSDEEREEMLAIINRNNTLLLKLVNDVLELSRIESGNVTLDINTYEISKIVKEIYRTHEVIIRKDLEFELKIDDFPAFVRIDKLRFIQVISNFLSNANKFTSKGKITLGYYFDRMNDEACVYVEDTGKGIEPDQQKMIFSRFYKTDEFAQGTGLGLSICKVIIQRLRGHIEVQSQVGKGSRFSAFIPIVHEDK